MVHELKCCNPYFQGIWDGLKTFEVRKNDRNYEEGDTLVLREYVASGDFYTGRVARAKVPYIIRHKPYVPEGYVVMSIKNIKRSKGTECEV